MMNRFHIYPRADGDYGWRAVAKNGNILADSGEGYATKRGAEKALDGFIGFLRTNMVKVVHFDTTEEAEAAIAPKAKSKKKAKAKPAPAPAPEPVTDAE